MQYLDRWLERYNVKHNTRFTCLGIETVTD
jgi:hypothetical protein